MTHLNFKTLYSLKVLAPHRPVEIAAAKRERISSRPRAVLLSKKQVRAHTASACLHDSLAGSCAQGRCNVP